MTKQFKHMMSLFLAVILLLSGLGITLQHLECNHCDLFSEYSPAEKTEVSACCMHTGMTANAVQTEDLCGCSENIHLSEQNKEIQTTPPVNHSTGIVLFTCLLFLFVNLRVPVTQRLNSSFNSSSLFIASGRQILSLNAILLI